MEKRVLVAVVLSFLVLYLYQAFLAPTPPKTPPKAVVAERPTGSAAVQASGGAGEDRRGPAAISASPAPVVSRAIVSEAVERDVVVENAVLRAVFTNRGGRVKSWVLKGYKDGSGRLVDLVPAGVSPVLPFSLETGDSALDTVVNDSLFRVSEDGRGGGAADVKRVVFEYQDAAGVVAKKVFELSPTTFTVTFSADVTVGGQSANLAVAMGPALGDVQTTSRTSQSQKANGLLLAAGKVKRLDAGAIVAQATQEGVWSVVGMDDHYFMSAALLDGKSAAGVRYRHYWVPKTPTRSEHDFIAYALNPAGHSVKVTFYLGPKSFSTLKAVNGDLVKAINFGFFAWLAVPLLQGLNGVDAYIHNYGWSIIVLTILINLAIFPLRHKSFVSMRKMQALQPEMKAIQERYGKLKATDPDRQKMNTELMQLYRDRGVNPASGCVPILLTMPVLFAFYSFLSVAIELRGAPFLWWIKDLSIHDPLYITPVLMGITMVVQQKMTPSQADPVQQKMMMFMPVMFTGMFLWAPSGLVIYWFMSNILAIGQQYATNRMLPPLTPKDLRPMKKKDGRLG